MVVVVVVGIGICVKPETGFCAVLLVSTIDETGVVILGREGIVGVQGEV